MYSSRGGIGARGTAIIPREGFPSYLAGLNQRMRPVTPPEGAPRGMRHRAVAVSSMVPRGSVLAGLNQRRRPVTPPEGYPATLGQLNMPGFDKARIAAIAVGALTPKMIETMPWNLIIAGVAGWWASALVGGRFFESGFDEATMKDAFLAVVAAVISKQVG